MLSFISYSYDWATRNSRMESYSDIINFIALMLILTMAMNIHLSTQFLQLKKNNPNLKKVN